MEQELNAYLERVDRCLKPMSAWERVDIVQEIRSEILELAEQGLGAGAIMERLGAPRELAAAYLRDAIVKNPRFSWRRLGAVVAFYSLATTATGNAISGGMVQLPSCMTIQGTSIPTSEAARDSSAIAGTSAPQSMNVTAMMLEAQLLLHGFGDGVKIKITALHIVHALFLKEPGNDRTLLISARMPWMKRCAA